MVTQRVQGLRCMSTLRPNRPRHCLASSKRRTYQKHNATIGRVLMRCLNDPIITNRRRPRRQRKFRESNDKDTNRDDDKGCDNGDHDNRHCVQWAAARHTHSLSSTRAFLPGGSACPPPWKRVLVATGAATVAR